MDTSWFAYLLVIGQWLRHWAYDTVIGVAGLNIWKKESLFPLALISFGDLGGENYVNLIRVYVSRVKLNIPARIVKLPGKGRYAKTTKKGTLIEIEVVQYGYQFFETFRGIISYMYLSQKERSQSRHFFLNRTTRDGFKVFEVPNKGDDDLSQRNGQEKEGGASNKEDDQHVQDFRAELHNLLIQQKEENTGIFDDAYDDREVGTKADLNNLETTMNVGPIPITRNSQRDHPKDRTGDINSATQTRRMTKISKEHAMVWTLVHLPKGKRAIRTKWVYRNKKDDRGIIVRNKARLVAQGYTQEEGINYDEVFAPVARIEAIRLFLAYALFMGFIVYQMDVKSAFLYGTIEEEVYACQPPGFEDPLFPNKVYKVEKDLYGLHQAPRAWYETLSTYLLENGFRRGIIDKNLFIKKDKDNAQEIPDEFYGVLLLFRLQIASTPMEPNKALIKDTEADSVDVHLYRSMIRSLMYLTASRPDIMFAVCTCSRFQVTPKMSHLHAVKRIFRYLKGQSKLGLWYPRDSPFDLEAFFYSDYAGASLDRKSKTRGCQFIGKRLISWQCAMDPKLDA
ncbi:putative ribonuclease H-like domain-containing protein [Tanacetum coccineum]